MAGDAKDVQDNKVMAAIGYIGVLCFVPLLMAKESKFAQFHGKQGLVLFIIDVIVMFVTAVVGWIPLIGWLIAFVLSIGVIVVSILGLVKALSGEWYEMPVIGELAKKINL